MKKNHKPEKERYFYKKKFVIKFITLKDCLHECTTICVKI